MCACERVKGLTSHSWSIGSFAFVGYGTRYNRCTQGRFMDGAEKGEGRAWSGQYWDLFLESLIVVVVVLFVA